MGFNFGNFVSDTAQNFGNAGNQYINSYQELGSNPSKALQDNFNAASNGVTAPIVGATGQVGGYFNTGGYGQQISPWTNQPTGDSGSGSSADQPIGAAPLFNPVYNPTTMSELPGYMQEQAANSTGLNTLRSLATTQGSSPWATAAMATGTANMNNALDKGASAVKGQSDAANAALSMQGGLSEGAREHNAEAAEKGFSSMSQGLNQQNSVNNLGVLQQDQSNKLGELGQLTGAENQQVQGYMQAKNADTQNQIGENQALNNYNMNLYGINSSATAANNNSNAVANSAKKGLFQ